MEFVGSFCWRLAPSINAQLAAPSLCQVAGALLAAAVSRRRNRRATLWLACGLYAASRVLQMSSMSSAQFLVASLLIGGATGVALQVRRAETGGAGGSKCRCMHHHRKHHRRMRGLDHKPTPVQVTFVDMIELAPRDRRGTLMLCLFLGQNLGALCGSLLVFGLSSIGGGWAWRLVPAYCLWIDVLLVSRLLELATVDCSSVRCSVTRALHCCCIARWCSWCGCRRRRRR